MKIILTTIILILCVCTSVILITEYRHAAENKIAAATPAPVPPPSPAAVAAPLEVKPAPIVATATAAVKPANKKISGLDVKKLIAATSSQGLQPKALKSALNAYVWARDNGKLGSNKDILTVVDFTLPSYQKRMWVVNLRKNEVVMKLHTTQGAGSGLIYANRFSNTSRTQASSLGLYVTSEQYYGKHGKSMRLDGLQKGFNSNARNRSIVIHEAAYAAPAYVRANHRTGRSWGCFAVAPASKQELLNHVKGGSALFAYARQIEKTSIVSNGPISI